MPYSLALGLDLALAELGRVVVTGVDHRDDLFRSDQLRVDGVSRAVRASRPGSSRVSPFSSATARSIPASASSLIGL